MDCPQRRSTDHAAAHRATGSGGSGHAIALLPAAGAARDALIYLCGQPQAMVDAGIAAFMNRCDRRIGHDHPARRADTGGNAYRMTPST